MSITRIPSTDALELPAEAIVIADAALPDSLLEDLRRSAEPLLVEAGESLKTLASVERLAERVLQRRSSRPLTIVAVGGGSIGDAVGFLASILWRGVDLWHVPTTLLAMVDSAHGGKTAVNLGTAKNQLGTFYPADRVLLVDDALATLPRAQRRDGLAELVKGLWLGDAHTLEDLEQHGGPGELAEADFEGVADRLMDLLQAAIHVKLDIVDRDPFEKKGIRTVLNLGHTVAHTLELHTGISHGQAVGWGMLAASFASGAHAGLSSRESARLRAHVRPLITPSADVRHFRDRATFNAGIARDKKRVDGRLRSVLLEAPGRPRVTDELTADDWFDAFRKATDWYRTAPLRLRRPTEARESRESDTPRRRHSPIEISASKSEMNRACVIEHLRPGDTLEIDGHSDADDVVWLQRALIQLKRTAPGDAADIYCGEGGTTFRFLTAVAAARPGVTRLRVADPLLDRPHDPLFDALRAAGARIEPLDSPEARDGFRVRGWERWPERIAVSVERSSQYASAIALLAARGEAFELDLTGDGPMTSRPYFDMTLDLLRDAGVAVDDSTPRRLRFSPTDALGAPGVLRVDRDASSAAVWQILRLLGVDIALDGQPARRQPDARAGEIVRRLAAVADTGPDKTPVDIDLGDSPDLGPMLAAAATQIETAVTLCGAPHLRHKESDRIGDLASALADVGIDVEPRPDGLAIPAGIQRPTPGAAWATHDDHRLAMAALALTASGPPLEVQNPMVVTKSYPRLWHHARQAGWWTEQA